MSGLLSDRIAVRINHPGPRPEPIPLKLFMRKVRFDANGCWTWTAFTSQGYGMFRMNGRKNGLTERSHRIAYQMFVGNIPDGLVLDHLCRNRACVNPQHLEAVTHKENILRGEGAGAQAARSATCAGCGGPKHLRKIMCGACTMRHNRWRRAGLPYVDVTQTQCSACGCGMLERTRGCDPCKQRAKLRRRKARQAMSA